MYGKKAYGVSPITAQDGAIRVEDSISLVLGVSETINNFIVDSIAMTLGVQESVKIKISDTIPQSLIVSQSKTASFVWVDRQKSLDEPSWARRV